MVEVVVGGGGDHMHYGVSFHDGIHRAVYVKELFVQEI